MAKWVLRRNAGDIQGMMNRFNLSETTAQVLLNRDIRDFQEARKFLYPEPAALSPLNAMRGVTEAYGIINDSILKRDRITIYGDYDVDGVMSVVILYKALKGLGADVSYYIPQREDEGYGMNIEAVRKLKAYECDLIIACDNGIAACQEIAEAKKLGMKVVVIDHHEPGFVVDETGKKTDVLPAADAIIDPKQASCAYHFNAMCAAGLCYRFATGLYESMGRTAADSDELLALAGIATFCDIVDLIDENRIIAKNGLELINTRAVNLGLSALIKERGLSGKSLSEFEIGFIIGPCINASGRLENASTAVKLLLTSDAAEAAQIAKKLAELNEERKAMTASSYEALMDKLPADKVIVFYDENTHESVAGIVAGRIKEKTHRPVIVLAKGLECAKGSARSIEGYNIFEELFKCRELFERFGGHAMAAGLSIKEENIDALRKRLNDNCTLSEDDFTDIIRIDKALNLSLVTYELACELNTLKPFGKGNNEPVFGAKDLPVEGLKYYGEKNTIIFTFSIPDSYRKIKGVSFGQTERFKEMLEERYDAYTVSKILSGVLRTAALKLDIVYGIEINEYNGNVSVDLRLKDFRMSGV